MVESVKDYFILTIDQDGILDGWTAAAARAFGYTEEEAIGQHVSLVFTEEDRKDGVPEQELRDRARARLGVGRTLAPPQGRLPLLS